MTPAILPAAPRALYSIAVGNLKEVAEDEIPETDFSGGVRGKYYRRYREGTNIVLLDSDLKVFRDSSVDEPPKSPKAG